MLHLSRRSGGFGIADYYAYRGPIASDKGPFCAAGAYVTTLTGRRTGRKRGARRSASCAGKCGEESVMPPPRSIEALESRQFLSAESFLIINAPPTTAIIAPQRPSPSPPTLQPPFHAPPPVNPQPAP